MFARVKKSGKYQYLQIVENRKEKGKVKQRGRIVGKRNDWKKAIVTLMPGQRIDFFEGV